MLPLESAQPDTGPALYVYYRVHQAQAAVALEGIGRMFATLREAWPALCSTLHGRADQASVEELTWMEVHHHPGGVSAACREDIQAQAQRCLGSLIGTRHTEVFVPIDMPAFNSLA